jgi:ribose 5-phosphate isomerase A
MEAEEVMEREELKRLAGYRAAEYVVDGTVVGLGTGSTTAYTIEVLGARVREGLRIRGIPTSVDSERLAREAGIPLTSLEECPQVDLTIDGADEVDRQGNLIKGRGGALFREKVVALASRRYVIVVDDGKLVDHLGVAVPLPVEVVPFAWHRCQQAIERIGGLVEIRRSNGGPFVTDNGNYILDCRFFPLPDPSQLGQRLRGIMGVVEHGLFLDMDPIVLVAGRQGVVERAPCFGGHGRLRP